MSIMKRLLRWNESQMIMSESERWAVKCQETSDGTGDVIVDLPLELLAKLGLGLGGELTIEVVDGAIVLEPNRRAITSIQLLNPSRRSGHIKIEGVTRILP